MTLSKMYNDYSEITKCLNNNCKGAHASLTMAKTQLCDMIVCVVSGLFVGLIMSVWNHQMEKYVSTESNWNLKKK